MSKNSVLLYASLPEAQLWSESLIPTTADFLQPESMMIHMAFQPCSPIYRVNP